MSIVAVDAGHGGDDPGATGSTGAHEKDITLAVARQLKKQIDKTPGMSAVLTRDGDYFVPLEKRYAKARDEKADLFVSIHADAFKTEDARGSSVWVLSPRGATNEASRWLADRENRADLVGGVSLDDKDDTLAAVLLDLSQGATMGASNAVAEQVLTSLRKLGPTHRGYVERANFVVLRSPDVPSILVETAFITNPAEEAKLKNPEHRETARLGDPRRRQRVFPCIAAAGQLVRGEHATQPPRKHAPADVALCRQSWRYDCASIAEHHGLSIAQLREANGLNEDRVRPGEILQIPSG